MAYNKNKLHETLNYSSIDMFNFDFLKKGLGIVSPPHFVHDFSRKRFLMLYCFNWPNFIVWLPVLFEILGNMCIAIVFFPRLCRHKFSNSPYFSIQAVFLHDQNVKTKVLISWELKEFLRWKKKHFSAILKGF